MVSVKVIQEDDELGGPDTPRISDLGIVGIAFLANISICCCWINSLSFFPSLHCGAEGAGVLALTEFQG